MRHVKIPFSEEDFNKVKTRLLQNIGYAINLIEYEDGVAYFTFVDTAYVPKEFIPYAFMPRNPEIDFSDITFPEAEPKEFGMLNTD